MSSNAGLLFARSGPTTNSEVASMLELVDVAKSFGGTQVLQPTTLRFERGRTTVLIGPSGCGKSTLLRIIIGLIEPDQGQVLIGGELLTPLNVMAQRRKIGYVIQDGGLFPHLSAVDNVGPTCTRPTPRCSTISCGC